MIYRRVAQEAGVLPDGGQYTWPFEVRHYELSRSGSVRPEVYLNWLQEAGILASARAGYPLERYAAMERFWWIRRMLVEWHGEARYRQLLEATTWISMFRKVHCHREYQIRHRDTRTLLCSAQADWAFVDIKIGQPTRIPEELITAFPESGLEAIAALPWPRPFSPSETSETSETAAFPSHRTVQHHDLDTMGHVNHAVYLVWLLGNLKEQANSLGGNIELDFIPRRFDIEYLVPAREGDRLEVSCRLIHAEAPQGIWSHEIRLEGQNKVLLRATSVCELSVPSNLSAVGMVLSGMSRA
jgi:acyl-CoA thioester hydrolase